jgi:hypothetical protein
VFLIGEDEFVDHRGVMQNFTYPTLRMAVLQGLVDLKQEFEADPGVLKLENCPYDAETIEILSGLLAVKTVTVERIIEKVVEAKGNIGGGSTLNGEEKDLVDQTIGELLKQLNELGEGEKNLDTSTKISIIKAKATLIDQMLKMHERIMNVKRVSEFQTIVIGILDDYVAEGDRAAFLSRLEIYRD